MDSDLIQEVATKHQVDAKLIEQLVDYEQTRVHLERRRGAKDQLRALIEQSIEEGDSAE